MSKVNNYKCKSFIVKDGASQFYRFSCLLFLEVGDLVTKWDHRVNHPVRSTYLSSIGHKNLTPYRLDG